jgi:hypothetical protein
MTVHFIQRTTSKRIADRTIAQLPLRSETGIGQALPMGDDTPVRSI